MSLKIIDFDPKSREHKEKFAELNLEWLRKYFVVEKTDEELFNDPVKNVIGDSGVILFALVNNEIVGTVALYQKPQGHYEVGKLAVTEKYQGHKIGEKLMLEIIDRAKGLRLDKIYLYSSTLLGPALNLYRKLGFVENDMYLNCEFKRCDISMELDLTAVYSLKDTLNIK